jgi:GT2 family glycosyltransferase
MINKKQPLVGIVIVNWNGGDKIYKCVETLINITEYNNYKVVIVDNNSSDNSQNRIKKDFNQVEILQQKDNLGYTIGMNIGWSYLINKYDVDYILDMNDDLITIQKEWLTLMVNSLAANPQAGLCGNKLIFPDGRLQLLYSDRAPKSYEEMDEGQYDFIKEVEGVGGANLLIKRSLINKMGALDENYFYGPDDLDYCFRAKKNGFKVIYNGFSKSQHVGSFSYLSASKDFIYNHLSYGMMLANFRHGGIKQRFSIIITELARALVTRKDPFRKKTLSNLYFHKTFLKRLGFYFPSLFRAMWNINKINNEHFILNEKL